MAGAWVPVAGAAPNLTYCIAPQDKQRKSKRPKWCVTVAAKQGYNGERSLLALHKPGSPKYRSPRSCTITRTIHRNMSCGQPHCMALPFDPQPLYQFCVYSAHLLSYNSKCKGLTYHSCAVCWRLLRFALGQQVRDSSLMNLAHRSGSWRVV